MAKIDIIHIDSKYHCHITNVNGTLRELVFSENAKDFFDNKCTKFIEGYRFVPSGKS